MLILRVRPILSMRKFAIPPLRKFMKIKSGQVCFVDGENTWENEKMKLFNSSSIQAKERKREKNSLTTLENFWCKLKWGGRALFIGEEPKISYKFND